METTKPSRRSPATTVTQSPRIRRTASGDSANSLPESRRSLTPSSSPREPIRRTSRSATSSPRPSIERSRSAMKLTTTTTTNTANSTMYKLLPSISTPKIPLPITTNTANFIDDNNNGAMRLRRASPHNMSIRRVRSTLTGSPSAWALSPGRTLAPLPPSSPSSPSPSLMTSPSLDSSLKTRSLSNVLRYFQRQKKTSPEEEEGLHQYRMMYNRLLQWRFANAKSEASMRIITKRSEEKLFAVWVKICKMRNSIAEKRSRVERLRLKIKLLEIVCPQLQLLNAWEVLDKRNSEAVTRIVRKLTALSMKLPLVNGAKVDIIDLYESMSLAFEVLQEIEKNITKYLSQTEETCYILTELINTMGEHEKCFEELRMEIAMIISLEEEEKSLRANLIQENKEVWESQNSCKYHRFVSFRNSGGFFNPLYSLLNVS